MRCWEPPRDTCGTPRKSESLAAICSHCIAQAVTTAGGQSGWRQTGTEVILEHFGSSEAPRPALGAPA